jgi:hypothetical protein
VRAASKRLAMNNRINVTWGPRFVVLVAAVVLFILAGIGVEIGGEGGADLLAWGLAVFAASFLL